VQFVVGGALSWHLHAFNLRREVPACADLDERVLAALRDGHWEALAGLAAKPGRTAHAEAGLRHLEVLRGFLFAGDVMGTVLEREQLPGIGSALVEFPVVSETGDTGD
jgi:hypothetical protein